MGLLHTAAVLGLLLAGWLGAWRLATLFPTVRARIMVLVAYAAVPLPSQATAYRILADLESRHPLFSKSTKRNRDIAGRGKHPYGKLRPNRPGEYLILDTTPLDVFAMDPVTLRWVRLELSAAMDWYTRCIVSIRLTPMSTKAVDAAALMYAAFRPPPACVRWPDHAVWPAHGIPRQVLIDPDQIDRTGQPASGPALSPDTIVVDHGKIYVSEHLNSVCQRMGISIQPVRIKEGRDKGPLERFFNTVRQGLLQYLPGYKGPDINSRGLDVESHAFFYLDELEAILAPIPGDQPAGIDLREDSTPTSVYFRLRDARADARDAERGGGDACPQRREPQWAGITQAPPDRQEAAAQRNGDADHATRPWSTGRRDGPWCRDNRHGHADANPSMMRGGVPGERRSGSVEPIATVRIRTLDTTTVNRRRMAPRAGTKVPAAPTTYGGW